MTVCLSNRVYVQLQVNYECKKSLFEQMRCNADRLYNKTFMDFSAGVHDVICTRKYIDIG